MDKDGEKQAVARAGLNFIQDGQVVGLGSGSTSAFFIQFLGERVRAGLQIRGIPTSMRAQQLAEKYGIRLATLDEIRTIDVDVDGADEFDPQFQLIKGGGGALLREKIVASVSTKFVVLADSSKQVPFLGKFPLPIEVIPFAETVLIKGSLRSVGRLCCERLKTVQPTRPMKDTTFWIAISGRFLILAHWHKYSAACPEWWSMDCSSNWRVSFCSQRITAS